MDHPQKLKNVNQMMLLVAVKQQMVYGPAGANGVPVFVTIATELEQLLELERVLPLLAAAGIFKAVIQYANTILACVQ